MLYPPPLIIKAIRLATLVFRLIISNRLRAINHAVLLETHRHRCPPRRRVSITSCCAVPRVKTAHVRPRSLRASEQKKREKEKKRKKPPVSPRIKGNARDPPRKRRPWFGVECRCRYAMTMLSRGRPPTGFFACGGACLSWARPWASSSWVSAVVVLASGLRCCHLDRAGGRLEAHARSHLVLPSLPRALAGRSSSVRVGRLPVREGCEISMMPRWADRLSCCRRN
jgi:hypothetical protein